MKNPTRLLSDARQRDLLRLLSELSSRFPEYLQTLVDRGFALSAMTLDYWNSYCDSDSLAVHQAFLQEEARLFVGTPSGVAGYLADNGGELPSQLMSELRAKRFAEFGVPFAELRSLWKREIDPCRRRMFYLRENDPQKFEEREEAFRRDLTARRSEEIAAHVPGWAHRIALGSASAPPSLREALEESYSHLGFAYDKRRSGPLFPVYSKAISDGWSLCVSADDQNKLIMMNVGADRRSRTTLYISCFLSSKKTRLTRSNECRGGYMLPLRVNRLVPGFLVAYSVISSIEDLALSVKANAALCDCVAADLEKILVERLSADDSDQ
jgi:hypothetical protein